MHFDQIQHKRVRTRKTWATVIWSGTMITQLAASYVDSTKDNGEWLASLPVMVTCGQNRVELRNDPWSWLRLFFSDTQKQWTLTSTSGTTEGSWRKPLLEPSGSYMAKKWTSLAQLQRTEETHLFLPGIHLSVFTIRFLGKKKRGNKAVISFNVCSYVTCIAGQDFGRSF